MCAKEGVFEAVTVENNVSPRYAYILRFRRLSSDVHSIRDHSHGTACDASMAMTVPLSRIYLSARMRTVDNADLCLGTVTASHAPSLARMHTNTTVFSDKFVINA